MSLTDYKTDWPRFRDGLVTRFPALSEADLSDADGDVAVLSQRLVDAEQLPLQEPRQKLEAFFSGPMPADAFAAPQNDNTAIGMSAPYIPEGEDPLADDARFGDDDQVERPIGRRPG